MIGITGEERGNIRVKDLIELVIACNRHGNLALESYTYRLQSLIDPYLGSRNRSETIFALLRCFTCWLQIRVEQSLCNRLSSS